MLNGNIPNLNGGVSTRGSDPLLSNPRDSPDSIFGSTLDRNIFAYALGTPHIDICVQTSTYTMCPRGVELK